MSDQVFELVFLTPPFSRVGVILQKLNRTLLVKFKNFEYYPWLMKIAIGGADTVLLLLILEEPWAIVAEHFKKGSTIMIDSQAFNIVLMQPEIPPNTGNIARLCAATETVLHLVEPLGFSIEDKHLKRAGLDYWEHVVIKRWQNLAELHNAEPGGRFFYLTTKASRSYLQATYKAGDFLVFGRETKGLPEELLLANQDTSITIPMTGKAVRSLNLSTSAGIVLYEALRQTGKV